MNDHTPISRDLAHQHPVLSEMAPGDREGALQRALLDVRRTLDAWSRELERSTDAVLHESVAAEDFLRREQEAWDAYVRAAANLKSELRQYRSWYTSIDRPRVRAG